MYVISRDTRKEQVALAKAIDSVLEGLRELESLSESLTDTNARRRVRYAATLCSNTFESLLSDAIAEERQLMIDFGQVQAL